MFGKGAETEAKELKDIQLAGFVLIVKALVFPFVVFGIDNVVLDKKAAPQVVTVAPEQGVIQVKDCQPQGLVPHLMQKKT